MAKKSERQPADAPPKRKSYLIPIGLGLLALAVGIGLVSVGSHQSSQPDENITNQDDTTDSARRSSARRRIVARQAAYEVVNSYPHDPKAFLQGLVWHNGSFYESTGLAGRSTLRHVEFPSGQVLQLTQLAPEYFGEGLALVDERLIQLTWQHGRGFVYDRQTLQLLQEFTYQGEGWGLTYDGRHLIMSNGTSTLTYLDPQTFQPVRQLLVTLNGRPLIYLNELEFIEGEIWANVWQRDQIMRIDPASGQVTSYLDLAGILPAEERTGREDVLNGIAYDPQQKRIFVSGKLWPRLFEIRLK